MVQCDLDLPEHVSNGTYTHDGEQFCQIILKSIHNFEVMVWTNSDRRMDVLTHIQRTVIVKTMSCSPQAGSTKTDDNQCNRHHFSLPQLIISRTVTCESSLAGLGKNTV